MREREEGWFSPYTSHVIGADFRRSTWTHNGSKPDINASGRVYNIIFK
jgi:hypothetical protein